jgi:hypothetical protein
MQRRRRWALVVARAMAREEEVGVPGRIYGFTNGEWARRARGWPGFIWSRLYFVPQLCGGGILGVDSFLLAQVWD